MIIKAYSKINLILNVVGKRADGYHEIESIMQRNDELYDEVEIEPREGCNDVSELIFFRDDLAAQALEAFQKAYGIKDFYSVRIKKNIPVAAGLGGGSADAAAVITALCKIYGIDCGDLSGKPYQIAASLGADVPFCLAAQNGHKACICRGIGELLEPCEGLSLSFKIYPSDTLIMNKTAMVYGRFDKLMEEGTVIPRYDTKAFLAARSDEERLLYLGNMLQPALESITGVHREEILCGAGPSYYIPINTKKANHD